MSGRNILVLATGNAKKARELAAIAGDGFVVKTMSDFGVAVDVDELSLIHISEPTRPY